MDIEKQCFKNGLVDTENTSLDEYLECYLIEGFDQIKNESKLDTYKVVLRGFLIDKESLDDDDIIVIDNKPVDPKKIEFPAYLFNSYFKGIFFEQGEVKIPINLSEDKFNEFAVRGGVSYNGAFEAALLPLIGKQELTDTPIDMKYRDIYYADNNIQDEIYSLIGEDKNQSYYDLALKHGFDTSRFFQ